MKILTKTEESFIFEFWGGHHEYIYSTKTYLINRPYGIFSNMTISIYAIFILEKNGFIVDNVEFILNEYIGNVDLYELLFQKKNNPLDLQMFDEQSIENFEKNCFPSFYGLTNDINKLDLRITHKIIDKFFQPSEYIKKLYDTTIEKKQFDLVNSVFIWARKTDKVRELKIPTVSTYINLLKSQNLINKKIILQTDDMTVFTEFKSYIVNFEYLDFLPFSTDGSAFHGRLDLQSDDEFYKKYSITKFEYIGYMFVSSLICKNSQHCIIYPGNPTTYIPIIKKTFENCFLFTDDEKYLRF